MVIHCKLDQMMTREHRAALGEMLSDVNVTIDQVRDWLLERGYQISRSSVGRYMLRHRKAEPMLEVMRRMSDPELHQRAMDLLRCFSGEALAGVVWGIETAAAAMGKTSGISGDVKASAKAL